MSLSALASPTLLTPQGDGNKGKKARWIRLSPEMSPTLLTPQGDGNGISREMFEADRAKGPPPSLPRKGTETWPSWPGLARLRHKCPPPSLPRKGTETLPAPWPWLLQLLPCPPPSLPRKGTETSGKHANGEPYYSLMSPTLLTPQGDGNSAFELASSSWVSRATRVPHPPYPARGRKRAVVSSRPPPEPGIVPHPPYPARGRKLNIDSEFREFIAACPPPSLPRKGTET